MRDELKDYKKFGFTEPINVEAINSIFDYAYRRSNRDFDINEYDEDFETFVNSCEIGEITETSDHVEERTVYWFHDISGNGEDIAIYVDTLEEVPQEIQEMWY